MQKAVERFTQAELVGHVLSHEKFLGGSPGGRRMILPMADLTGLAMPRRNLADADLSGASMRGCDLSGTVLDRAMLFGSDMRGSNLAGASLLRADLRGAVLCGADLSGADLTDADFRPGQIAAHSAQGFISVSQRQRAGMPDGISSRIRADVNTAYATDFTDATLRGAKMNGAKMKSANFTSALLEEADFTSANLENADFTNAVMSGSILLGSTTHDAIMDRVVRAPTAEALSRRPALLESLAGHQVWCLTNGKQGSAAQVEGADLRVVGDALAAGQLTGLQAAGACFVRLNLEGTFLQAANLEGADLRGANLRGADLRGARLTGANLARADLRGAILMHMEIGGRTTNTDLTGARFSYADCRGALLSPGQLDLADAAEARFDRAA